MAGVGGVVPFAEIGNLSTFSSGVLDAVTSALELDGIPDATRIGITGGGS